MHYYFHLGTLCVYFFRGVFKHFTNRIAALRITSAICFTYHRARTEQLISSDFSIGKNGGNVNVTTEHPPVFFLHHRLITCEEIKVSKSNIDLSPYIQPIVLALLSTFKKWSWKIWRWHSSKMGITTSKNWKLRRSLAWWAWWKWRQTCRTSSSVIILAVMGSLSRADCYCCPRCFFFPFWDCRRFGSRRRPPASDSTHIGC